MVSTLLTTCLKPYKLNHRHMKTTNFILITLFVFLSVVSCKEETTQFKDEAKTTPDVADKTLSPATKSDVDRVTLGKTKLSLISERSFLFDSTTSALTEDDKIYYSYKESYFYETSSGSYILLNYSLGKDNIALSLTGGLEGALENLAATMNAIIIDRVDTNVDKTIGHPALFSKGLAKSKNVNDPSLAYRVLITRNDQQLYMLIGMFPPNDSTEIKAFESMVETIQIN